MGYAQGQGQGVNTMDIENLDGISTDELARLHIGFALLARYCGIKQRAMRLRTKGIIPKALELEATLEKIYQQLPSDLRW